MLQGLSITQYQQHHPRTADDCFVRGQVSGRPHLRSSDSLLLSCRHRSLRTWLFSFGISVAALEEQALAARCRVLPLHFLSGLPDPANRMDIPTIGGHVSGPYHGCVLHG